MSDNGKVIDWLLLSDEPWTRYRTRLDLLGEGEKSPAVMADRREMVVHPKVLELMDGMKSWGAAPFTRHSDAGYPIFKLTQLAEFGLRADDPGMDEICQNVMSHQSPDGAFQSVVSIPKAFGGDGVSHWTWMICDSPTLIYALLAMGYREDSRVQRAVDHLCSLISDNGYHCVVDSALGKFRGPGKKEDPCPIANLLVLRALSHASELWNHPAVKNSAEMLLGHWTAERGKKYYLFGIGKSYRKLKAPLVWYDRLHVCDALSKFPALQKDPRLQEMTQSLFEMEDENGRFTANSMYKTWDGWSFADKKNPSPWLTFLVLRIRNRMRLIE
ncbi:MAG: hypothetical protein AB9891_14060 [Anaerolineaceae bacterium]